MPGRFDNVVCRREYKRGERKLSWHLAIQPSGRKVGARERENQENLKGQDQERGDQENLKRQDQERENQESIQGKRVQNKQG